MIAIALLIMLTKLLYVTIKSEFGSTSGSGGGGVLKASKKEGKMILPN